MDKFPLTFSQRLKKIQSLLVKAEKSREWFPVVLALRNTNILVEEFERQVEEVRRELAQKKD